jgi:hypothetical protein
MFYWFAVLFVSLIGNVLIAQRYHTDIYEYMLLSVIIGPFSWIFQLRNRANDNL